MASNASVERTAVQSGIQICQTAIHELKTAAQRLSSGYQQAGSGGWRDQKYAQLGGIVEECTAALTDPISDLEACQNSLQRLLSAISGYEGINF